MRPATLPRLSLADRRAYRTDRLDDARGVIERRRACKVCGKRFRLVLQRAAGWSLSSMTPLPYQSSEDRRAERAARRRSFVNGCLYRLERLFETAMFWAFILAFLLLFLVQFAVWWLGR